MQKGFTLIELLVVIAIIGILSGVVLVSINEGNKKVKYLTEPEYCQRLGEENLRYLPAKCIKYFLNADERKIYLENVKK